MASFQAVSPATGQVFADRPFAEFSQVSEQLDAARTAWPLWRQTPLTERIARVRALLDAVQAKADTLAAEITLQMGRPIRFAKGEIDGFAFRGRTLCDLAPSALADIVPSEQPGFDRFIKHESLGVVLILAPWNYPWLTAVNALVPALLAGNTVLLKHSEQTPLVADRLRQAAQTAGLPDGVFQTVDMTNDTTAKVVADPRVAYVSFTGSVQGGQAVHAAAGGLFKGVGLELGGKDPAYVRADADLDHAAPNLVEGALFNSGQSCCGIERIYVHSSLYDAFVERFVAELDAWTVGDPMDESTWLGPMVRPRNADAVRTQVRDAVAAGAVCHTPIDTHVGSATLTPQVLTNVTDDMDIVREETFGPAVVIVPVADDDDAVQRMNDSQYGLTASIWTRSTDAARQLGDRLETGTVFANRCDYLDPELPWVGVKNSGRGITLSRLGFSSFTRPKSFHLREHA